MFQVFQDLEEKEIYTFKDETQKFTKKVNKRLDKSNLITYFGKDYSEYALNKMKEQLIESTNYKLGKKERGNWVFFLK